MSKRRFVRLESDILVATCSYGAMLERHKDQKEMERLRRLADVLRQALTDATSHGSTDEKSATSIKVVRGGKQSSAPSRQRLTRPKA